MRDLREYYVSRPLHFPFPLHKEVAIAVFLPPSVTAYKYRRGGFWDYFCGFRIIIRLSVLVFLRLVIATAAFVQQQGLCRPKRSMLSAPKAHSYHMLTRTSSINSGRTSMFYYTYSLHSVSLPPQLSLLRW